MSADPKPPRVASAPESALLRSLGWREATVPGGGGYWLRPGSDVVSTTDEALASTGRVAGVTLDGGGPGAAPPLSAPAGAPAAGSPPASVLSPTGTPLIPPHWTPRIAAALAAVAAGLPAFLSGPDLDRAYALLAVVSALVMGSTAGWRR